MKLPTTKPNYRDLDWYKAECLSLIHTIDSLNKKIDKLERENTALRIIQEQDKGNYQIAMKASMNVEQRLKGENAALKSERNRLFRVGGELEPENAALREALGRWLKVATDCHKEQQEVGYSEYNITVGLMVDTRELLDAARKEAQP